MWVQKCVAQKNLVQNNFGSKQTQSSNIIKDKKNQAGAKMNQAQESLYLWTSHKKIKNL